MELKCFEDPVTNSLHYTLIITKVDLIVGSSFLKSDMNFLKECSDSNSIPDTLLALELISRQIMLGYKKEQEELRALDQKEDEENKNINDGSEATSETRPNTAG